ncbi:hypothetical protein FGU71_06820 [Erythrobacter insulae]|uniref:Uncharacterized protein n=1 Tax=Erythrobacter insulae TaxID=2584124 RepID=A0A547PBT1_9SPHN|nr:hypothetical protein [Erythrobacter insulae]TRD11603.1 hypothetical protein FGU71_06820 [Erythrobacter insulae]
MPSAAFAKATPLADLADLQSLGEPIADEELGSIRGKFIRSDQISYFGISMITSWQDGAGITTTARLMFSIDFAAGEGGAVPQLLVGWVRDGDPAMDVTGAHEGYVPYIVPSDVIGVGGLDTQRGVAQANVIAGADNRTSNRLSIALLPASELQELQLRGLTPIEEGSGFSFDDGDTLQFRVADNQIGMMLTGGAGLDSSIQSIGGDTSTLLQQTVLNTHSNIVRNSTDILIGSGLGDTGTSARMSEAITVMRGFGF